MGTGPDDNDVNFFADVHSKTAKGALDAPRARWDLLDARTFKDSDGGFRRA
jgi:hypothetical protein